MAKDEEMHDTALESIVQISTKEEIRDYKTAEKLVNELYDKYKTEDRYAKAGEVLEIKNPEKFMLK